MRLLILLSSIALLHLGQATAAEKLFSYCSEASPSAFNPQITTDGTSNNASAHTIYNRLVEFKYGTTEVVPGLAQSWTISPDRTLYTFKLRKGVKFHQTAFFTPTREFNADDVLFSIFRQWDKNHPYHKINGGHYDYFESMEMGTLFKEVKKLDDYTISIALTRPEAPFLANMAMSFMSVLSQEYATHLEKQKEMEKIDHEPIGTGPFIFQKYAKDTLIRFQANPHYPAALGGKPKVDKLVFSITADASVRYQKLKTGECHLIIEPAPADISAMRADKNIKLLSGPGLNVGYLAMNTEKKPFDNLLVRQAINHALNKKNYIDAIYMGNAEVAKNPLPPTIWSYNKATKDYEYNIQKAKNLLAKAGYPDGFETELWTLPVTRPYNPAGKKMGEIMQADLAQIGIKAKLISYEWGTYLKKSREGEHALIQLGWTGDNGDPDNFLHVLLGCAAVKGGSNVSRWCHKDFDELIMQAKVITDQKKRSSLYQKAQTIFKTQAPWVPVAHSTIFRAMSSKVTGYKLDPLGGDIFHAVDVK